MAKLKLKAHSGASKRFHRTANGKFVRQQAGRRHILTSKARDRKRRLKGGALVSPADKTALNRILPYR